MSSPHDQYYDEDRRRWPYTDPDDSMSIQDLAEQLADPYEEGPFDPPYDYDTDPTDHFEAEYNEYLMNTGDI